MSGLLAKTVHQSPVVPSQRPGSATGSRPSKSQSYMVVTIGAVASSLGTWRRRGTLCGLRGAVDADRRLGWDGSLAGGAVGPIGGVRDVGTGEAAHPAGELQQDPVGVLEVDAAHVDARMHGVAETPFGVVVVCDLGAVDAGRQQAIAVLLDLLGRHVE